MNNVRFGRGAAALSIAALALTLGACGSDNATGTSVSGAAADSNVTGTLTGVGASSQNAAMDVWRTNFSQANSGAQVQYSPDGSGAGRKAFLAGGDTKFAGSDSYLKDEEFEASKDVCGAEGAFDVPVYISPIAVTFNLPEIKELNLDAATIAKIFRGEITTWNDPAIAGQNEGVTLPELNITAVHRSDDSGTTSNFTDYLSKAAGDVWTNEVSGDWPKDLGGEAAAKTSGVVKSVTDTEGAITYADESAVGGSLGTVALKVGEEYVKISPEAAAKAVEGSEQISGRNANDIAYKIDRTSTESGVYPLVLVSYQIFCSSYEDQSTVDLVKAWGNYVVSDEGQQAASAAAKNAPLSPALVEQATQAIDSIQVAK